MSGPSISEVIAAVFMAMDAHQYDEDFTPNWDGDAGYFNEAKGQLFEATVDWPRKAQRRFVAAFEGKHQYKTVATVLDVVEELPLLGEAIANVGPLLDEAIREANGV